MEIDDLDDLELLHFILRIQGIYIPNGEIILELSYATYYYIYSKTYDTKIVSWLYDASSLRRSKKELKRCINSFPEEFIKFYAEL